MLRIELGGFFVNEQPEPSWLYCEPPWPEVLIAPGAGKVISDQRQLAAVLAGVLSDGDILLMQGAGDIGRLSAALADSDSLEALQ